MLLEKSKKLAIIIGSMILISLCCLVLVLISLKFYILKEVFYQKTILSNIEKQYQTPDSMQVKGILQKYNKTFASIDNFYKTEIYFSDILKIILEVQRPQDLYFTNIVMEKSKDKENRVKVGISGVSNTRDDLLVFKDNINGNKKIENVYFPPDSWIKQKDINFSLTFEINIP